MGGPACFKLGAQHKKLRIDVESESRVVFSSDVNLQFLVPSAPSFSVFGPPAERTDDLIRNWIRNRNTIEFLGLWEHLNNPGFNPVEFDGF